MARTAINVYDLPGRKDEDGTEITPTGGDSANNHSAAFNGGKLIIVAEASDDCVVTIKSVPDPIYGRVGDHEVTLATGEYFLLGEFERSGFVQSDGLLHIDVSTDNVTLYGIRI